MLQDPRLPSAARLSFWLAFTYLFCPLDMKADFLPGGFIDDSVIISFLLVCRLLCLPPSFYRRSRKIAKNATCALVCMAVAASILSFPHAALSCAANTAGIPQTTRIINCDESTVQLFRARDLSAFDERDSGIPLGCCAVPIDDSGGDFSRLPLLKKRGQLPCHAFLHALRPVNSQRQPAREIKSHFANEVSGSLKTSLKLAEHLLTCYCLPARVEKLRLCILYSALLF